VQTVPEWDNFGQTVSAFHDRCRRVSLARRMMLAAGRTWGPGPGEAGAAGPCRRCTAAPDPAPCGRKTSNNIGHAETRAENETPGGFAFPSETAGLTRPRTGIPVARSVFQTRSVQGSTWPVVGLTPTSPSRGNLRCPTACGRKPGARDHPEQIRAARDLLNGDGTICNL